MAVPTGPATTYDELAAYMAQCAITLASSGRDVQEVMEILRCARDSFEAVRRSSDEDREDAEVQLLRNLALVSQELGPVPERPSSNLIGNVGDGHSPSFLAQVLK
ncbi:unnamed protein product [Cladocopium goreaui]|uniref:Uncharacterized protein n=1 Tax=Cladocopium goreaui TaxID=2562237 RepID=A0A9P1G1B2_9DINO|nr:unnamed protein product [Cladocopium goreaui]